MVGFRNSFPHGARRWASSIPRRISLHRKWLSQLNLSISGEAWRSAERKIISHKQCSISSITLHRSLPLVARFQRSVRVHGGPTQRLLVPDAQKEYMYEFEQREKSLVTYMSISKLDEWGHSLMRLAFRTPSIQQGQSESSRASIRFSLL